MNFSERLKELRLEAGITQQELAEIIGVTEGAIRKYENNIGKPRNNNLERISKYFGVSVSYLLGESNVKSGSKIDEVMEKLNVPRQEETLNFAKMKLIEQNQEDKLIQLLNSLVPYEVEEEQALSAGRGAAYTDEVGKEIIYWNKEVKYDRAIIIRGNSMEPDYHYGQIALIRYQNNIDVQGGIYAIDDIERGLAYIKSVYLEDKHLRLVSLNTDIDFDGNRLFPDILLPRNENTRIVGKVVEAFTPIEK